MIFLYFLCCWKNEYGYQHQKPRFGNLIYIGITKSLEKRLKQHLKQENKSTKQFKGKIKLAYYEKLENRSIAMLREKELKKLPRKKKIEIIKEWDNGM